MVIVRSTFVNGGAIVPIRWTSDARRQQQLLTRGYTTAKAEPPVSPSSKIKAREFRVRPHEAKKLLFEEALIATVSHLQFAVEGGYPFLQLVRLDDEYRMRRSRRYCSGRAGSSVGVSRTA
jgi:hypothetical protein